MGQPLKLDRGAIAALCRRFGVTRLAIFGSAVTDRFDPACSDVDFLVEFAPESASLDTYFGLKQALEDLFGRSVDLVSPNALRNPYFAERVEQTREELYAA